ncbi:MAG: hypothetical protein WDO19_17060 [Bacteroidota bacterium]
MKKRSNFLIALSLVLIAGCSPGTQIVTSWRDPDVTVNTKNLNKFIVAALLKDQSVRRKVEDEMAALVKGKAVQSYKEFGTDALKENDSSYNQKLKSEGFDGVVVMSLVDVQKSTRYVPGSGPMYYRTWSGYWGMSWSGFYNPGYYTTDKTFKVEVNVYSLKTDNLIWSGITSTIDPSGKAELFSDVSNTVYNKMKKEGFLK